MTPVHFVCNKSSHQWCSIKILQNSQEFCEIFEKTYFAQQLRTTACDVRTVSAFRIL